MCASRQRSSKDLGRVFRTVWRRGPGEGPIDHQGSLLDVRTSRSSALQDPVISTGDERGNRETSDVRRHA